MMLPADASATKWGSIASVACGALGWLEKKFNWMNGQFFEFAAGWSFDPSMIGMIGGLVIGSIGLVLQVRRDRREVLAHALDRELKMSQEARDAERHQLAMNGGEA